MGKLGSLISRHRHANWAFLDQSVVSGSNFIIGILLARFLGPEAFGVFVLLQSVMLYVNSFQGALIFQPMMSAAPQLVEQERSKYLQGVFAMQLILGLMLGLAVTLPEPSPCDDHCPQPDSNVRGPEGEGRDGPAMLSPRTPA